MAFVSPNLAQPNNSPFLVVNVHFCIRIKHTNEHGVRLQAAGIEKYLNRGHFLIRIIHSTSSAILRMYVSMLWSLILGKIPSVIEDSSDSEEPFALC